VNDLTALLERVRAETEPDIEFGGRIICAMNGTRYISAGYFDKHHIKVVAEDADGDHLESAFANPTESIDAALALVERMLTGADPIFIAREGNLWWASVGDQQTPDHWPPTAPLAILAALLSALIERKQEPA
jgi:hypothetical protein